jgi:hypothetical protein
MSEPAITDRLEVVYEVLIEAQLHRAADDVCNALNLRKARP